MLRRSRFILWICIVVLKWYTSCICFRLIGFDFKVSRSSFYTDILSWRYIAGFGFSPFVYTFCLAHSLLWFRWAMWCSSLGSCFLFIGNNFLLIVCLIMHMSTTSTTFCNPLIFWTDPAIIIRKLFIKLIVSCRVKLFIVHCPSSLLLYDLEFGIVTANIWTYWPF